MKVFTIFTLLVVSMFMGCAAHTQLEPAGKGELRYTAGLGGPVVGVFGTHLPIPYTVAGIDYGLRDHLDISTSLHLLPFAYRIGALDAGATWYHHSSNTDLQYAIQGRILAMASLKSDVETRFSFLPWFTGTASYPVNNRHYYLGCNLAVPFKLSEYDDDTQPLIVSPFVGVRWLLGRRLSLFTELKWQGANLPSDQLAVDYVHLGRQGAVTPLITLQWTPGREGKR